MLPMYHWRNQRENQKISGDIWKWKHNNPKSMGNSKNSSKRKVYSNTSLPQGIRKFSNNQSSLTSKGSRKRTTKPKVRRRKEIPKIRAKIQLIFEQHEFKLHGSPCTQIFFNKFVLQYYKICD